MKTILFLSFVLLFMACSSTRIYSNMQGEYSGVGKDYSYDLILNKDSTAVFTQMYPDVKSSCKGQWGFISRDTILLKCSPESLPAPLSQGYMTEREIKIVVLNQNRLRIGQVVLKRK